MNPASLKYQHSLRDLLGVGLFTGACMLVAITAALNADNRDFIISLIAMALLITASMALHTRVRLSRGFLWALAMWGGLHMTGCAGPTSATVSRPYVTVVNAVLSMYPIEDLENAPDASSDPRWKIYVTMAPARAGSVQPAIMDSKCLVRHFKYFDSEHFLTEFIHTRETSSSLITSIEMTAQGPTSTLISIETRGFNTLATLLFGVEPRHPDYEQERLSEILRELGVEVEE